jgi:uncharacterized membrane protein YdbT with pleckstrin-like domain
MPTTVDHDGYLRKVLSKDERILFIVREHGLFLFGRIFIWLVAALVILAAVTVLLITHPALSALSAAYIFLLVPLLPIWWTYAVWTNHKYVVTNRRVLQLKGVLSKEVIDASLDQINDVKTEQSLLGRMLDFGDVQVVTASEILTDDMKHIARPLEFKHNLMDAKEVLLHPAPHPTTPAA